MRSLHGAPLHGVSLLRRGVAALAVASLVALSVGPYFHPGVDFAASVGTTAKALQPAVGSASLPHGSAHVPGQCPICRLIAQTRLGLRSPAIATSTSVGAVGVPVAFVDQHAEPRSAWLTPIEPRAPPSAPPVQSS